MRVKELLLKKRSYKSIEVEILSQFLIKSIVFRYKTKTIDHAKLIGIANYGNEHSSRRILQASMDNCIPNDYNQ